MDRWLDRLYLFMLCAPGILVVLLLWGVFGDR